MYVTVKVNVKEIEHLDSVVSKINEINKKHPNVIKDVTIEVQESEIISQLFLHLPNPCMK